jgi:hypothetical protein
MLKLQGIKEKQALKLKELETNQKNLDDEFSKVKYAAKKRRPEVYDYIKKLYIEQFVVENQLPGVY